MALAATFLPCDMVSTLLCRSRSAFTTRVSLALLAVCAAAGSCLGWDGSGHRMITKAALEGLSADMPPWLKDEDTLTASVDLAQQPDRWRSVKVPQLKHVNDPDHYIDVEDLEPFGMTLRTMPPLRHEYVKQLALAREKPDFKGPPINPAQDQAKTLEYPGFVAHATLENYGRLVGAFRMVRMFGTMKDEKHAGQIEAAQWNARIQIGVLSHFVGDTAQPLHTTKHHHGWVGENPEGYTTDRKIHSYIDGEILKIHAISVEDIKAKADFERRLSNDLWGDTLTYTERSFKEVEPLYLLKKSGELEQSKGKEFIVGRLADASSQLSALIESAWAEAAPTAKDVDDLKKFEDIKESGKAQPPQGSK